jgi:hypothetical protein
MQETKHGFLVLADISGFTAFVTETEPTLHEGLDLGPSHGVAFDGGRVVHVIDPDGAQNVVRVDRTREAAKVLME